MPIHNLIRSASKRRRIRLTLGVLMFAVALIALWLGRQVNLVNKQRAALAAIKALGGRVDFDYEVDAKGVGVDGGRPWGPAWLRKLIGDDYFRSIARVYLHGPHSGGPPISDRNIVFLGGLTDLRVLAITGCDITDEALTCLQSSPHLQTLALGFTTVGDASARSIERLTDLEILFLTGTNFTDAGMTCLRNKTKLRSLYLTDLPVTDAMAKSIEELTELEQLDLAGTKFTDAGLSCLRNKTKLRTLGLRDLPVTDEGLVHLSKLSGLDRLILYGTKVTSAGVVKLQEALPHTNILSNVDNPNALPQF